MITEHAAAVLALLDANLNLTVFDGAPPDLTEPPYVVAWVSLDNEEPTRLCDEQDKPNLRVTTHSVASTGAGARIVADQVRSSLLGQRMTVTGRSTWKLRHEFGVPPQLDESTGHPLVDAVDVWTFASVPA